MPDSHAGRPVGGRQLRPMALGAADGRGYASFEALLRGEFDAPQSGEAPLPPRPRPLWDPLTGRRCGWELEPPSPCEPPAPQQPPETGPPSEAPESPHAFRRWAPGPTSPDSPTSPGAGADPSPSQAARRRGARPPQLCPQQCVDSLAEPSEWDRCGGAAPVGSAAELGRRISGECERLRAVVGGIAREAGVEAPPERRNCAQHAAGAQAVACAAPGHDRAAGAEEGAPWGLWRAWAERRGALGDPCAEVRDQLRASVANLAQAQALQERELESLRWKLQGQARKAITLSMLASGSKSDDLCERMARAQLHHRRRAATAALGARQVGHFKVLGSFLGRLQAARGAFGACAGRDAEESAGPDAAAARGGEELGHLLEGLAGHGPSGGTHRRRSSTLQRQKAQGDLSGALAGDLLGGASQAPGSSGGADPLSVLQARAQEVAAEWERVSAALGDRQGRATSFQRLIDFVHSGQDSVEKSLERAARLWRREQQLMQSLLGEVRAGCEDLADKSLPASEAVANASDDAGGGVPPPRLDALRPMLTRRARLTASLVALWGQVELLSGHGPRGALAAWNQEHPMQQVRAGDSIVLKDRRLRAELRDAARAAAGAVAVEAPGGGALTMLVIPGEDPSLEGDELLGVGDASACRAEGGSAGGPRSPPSPGLARLAADFEALRALHAGERRGRRRPGEDLMGAVRQADAGGGSEADRSLLRDVLGFASSLKSAIADAADRSDSYVAGARLPPEHASEALAEAAEADGSRRRRAVEEAPAAAARGEEAAGEGPRPGGEAGGPPGTDEDASVGAAASLSSAPDAVAGPRPPQAADPSPAELSSARAAAGCHAGRAEAGPRQASVILSEPE
ncbi:unnamed protein product, partial [Prorocentrum cordatum]